MRVVFSFSPSLNISYIGDDLYRRLLDAYPAGAQLGGGFQVRLSANDARVNEMLRLLREAGLEPWEDRTRKKKDSEFGYRYVREYDDHDLTEAPFFALHAFMLLDAWEGRTDDGILRLNRVGLRDGEMEQHGYEIVNCSESILVSDRVRGLLKDSDLGGWRLSPTRLMDGPDYPEREATNWAEVGGPWWELWSDFVLPPLNREKIEVTDNRGNPIPPESDKPVGYIREIRQPDEPRFMSGVEYHFKRRDFERVPPFDIAGLHEKRSRYESERPLIVSQRFRAFLNEHGIKGATYIPVRIDDD